VGLLAPKHLFSRPQRSTSRHFCGLFCDACGTAYYAASDGKMMDEWRWKGFGRKQSWPGICLEGLKKIMTNFVQGNWCPWVILQKRLPNISLGSYKHTDLLAHIMPHTGRNTRLRRVARMADSQNTRREKHLGDWHGSERIILIWNSGKN
jgi:hypothetical protein